MQDEVERAMATSADPLPTKQESGKEMIQELLKVLSTRRWAPWLYFDSFSGLLLCSCQLANNLYKVQSVAQCVKCAYC